MSTDHFQQDQFLDVIDRDEAEQRFQAALDLRPLEAEEILLAEALDRVLVQDIIAPLDVPGFDRSNVDGFAVQARDTFGASEDRPCTLTLNREILATGAMPAQPVLPGTATVIATGAVIPRGADAVVMIEDTDASAATLLVRRPVTPGANITFAGTDIGRGETVLRRGERLTARETGVLAALGIARVAVVRRPRVAIVSTGDELLSPGAPMRPGLIYDSNATILADAVRELAEPVPLGIVPDDRAALETTLRRALACDVVLLSGGTSKGAGDLSYRVVADLGQPGIIAHGVALKPGKPLCLAAIQPEGRPRPVPVVVLPGFPTSAIFTFHEFVAPVIRRLGGRREDPSAVVTARLPQRVNSERGRTEYLLVSLVLADEDLESRIEDRGSRIEDRGSRIEDRGSKIEDRGSRIEDRGSRIEDRGSRIEDRGSIEGIISPSSILYSPSSILYSPSSIRDPPSSIRDPPSSNPHWVAYPMGKGSGSVTTFSRADGFVIIPRQREYLEAGDAVAVHLLSRGLRPVDLVVIGSHCVGLDFLLGQLQEQGWRSKFLAVGSTGGLTAARRGECDLAGIHLLDPRTGTYNAPFLSEDLVLLPGYGRLQGIVFRLGDARLEGQSVPEAVRRALADPACVLVNRNRGSGTRVLIDQLLGDHQPAGYWTEARSHNAVAAAVVQGRADWGVAIAPVAADAGLGFLPLQEERYDFVVPRVRWDRPGVQAFRELLSREDTRQALAGRGFFAKEDCKLKIAN